MEVIAFSVLSAVVFNLVCIASFLFYKRFKKVGRNFEEVQVQVAPNSKQTNPATPKKLSAVKKKTKKIQQHRKRHRSQDDDASGTENYTTEQQLVQTIVHQQFTKDSINATALDEKPSAKRVKEGARSAASKIPLPALPKEEWDSEWENVTDKRKKKVYTITRIDDRYQFSLDVAGGIVELPFCEIHFPAESVREPLLVSVQTETYGKFVDDTEDKVFVTPAVHFVTTGDSSLKRQFMLKLHSMKMMGRGWSGVVCCQIERKDPENSWMTIGRTEFLQAMPVNIVGDRLTSFRAVVTRAQSGDISRNLNVAAYIAKPKISNPKNHYLHICIYDNSQQTQHKVHSNMQKLLLKMQPKMCNIPFGCNVELKVEPTQKYTPDDKEIFMRWTEVCKAFVNVRFQIRLNRSESVHPNFEPQFRTMVFLTLNKVGTVQTWKQEEYFYFYWISGNFFPKKLKYKDQRKDSTESERARISDDDGFASGSDVMVGKVAERTRQSQKTKLPLVSAKNILPTKPVIKSVQRSKSKKVDAHALSSDIRGDNKYSSPSNVHNKQAKPVKSQQSKASAVSNRTGKGMEQNVQNEEAKVLVKHSTSKVHNKQPKPVMPRQSKASAVGNRTGKGMKQTVQSEEVKVLAKISTGNVHNKQPKPVKSQQSEASVVGNQTGKGTKQNVQSEEAKVLVKNSTSKVHNKQPKPVKSQQSEASAVSNQTGKGTKQNVQSEEAKVRTKQAKPVKSQQSKASAVSNRTGKGMKQNVQSEEAKVLVKNSTSDVPVHNKQPKPVTPRQSEASVVSNPTGKGSKQTVQREEAKVSAKISTSHVHNKQPKPVTPRQSEASVVSNQTGKGLKQTVQREEVKVIAKNSTSNILNKQPKPVKSLQSGASAVSNQTGKGLKQTVQSEEVKVLTKDPSTKFYRRRKKANSSKQNYDPNHRPTGSTPDSGSTGKGSDGQSTLKNPTPQPIFHRTAKI